MDRHADIYHFVQQLIALRMNRDLPAERRDLTLAELIRKQPAQWHGIRLNAPD